MREPSKAFREVVREMCNTYEWTLLQTLAGWHGDDFYTEGDPCALDEVDEMIIALCLGPDRFDLQFAMKELAQDMQTPSKTVCQVSSRCGRRGTVLRVPG